MISNNRKECNAFSRSIINTIKSRISVRNYLLGRKLLKSNIDNIWVSIFCPIHKSGKENKPSLRVNTVDGHFRCMACNISGGDIIALHRIITGKSFKDAVADLARI